MAGLQNYKPLRLMAEDAGDLEVISSVLQDAIAKIGDFTHLPAQRRFAFVANRFVWEGLDDKARGPFARVRVGCHFDDVVAVRQQHLRADNRDGVVELLAIRFEPAGEGAGAAILDFAGGGAIRLELETVNCELRDLSDPWPTRLKPAHDA